MKEIKKIVLTGGPCAGKTTAMSWIQNNFEKQGYKVLFIPEAATTLINGGITPWEARSVKDFQNLLMKVQIENEKAFMNSVEFLPYDKILIVCDRGLLDSRAYMEEEEFQECLKENGISYEDAKERYDACFHLVSAAKGAKESYNLGNTARTETIEQAIELDDKTLCAWIGHSHLRVIDNSTDFDSKMLKLMREISNVLGVPHPFEIERKFLIKKPNLKYLSKLPNCEKVKIVQTYLKSEDGSEVRIRQRGSKDSYTYTKTQKIKVSDTKRIEIEKRLSLEEYINELANADTRYGQIIKDRYCLCYENQYFEIDVYPFMEDEAIVEIELLDENQKITIPSYLQVIDEVTDNEEYKNVNLAKKIVR